MYNTSQGHITLLSRSSIITTAWRSSVDLATNILVAALETHVCVGFCCFPQLVTTCIAQLTAGEVFSIIFSFEIRYLSRGKRSISGDESEGETRRVLAPSAACISTRGRACPSLDRESLYTGQRGIVSVRTTFFIRENCVRFLFWIGLYMYIFYNILFIALMSLSRAFKRIWMKMCKV